MTLTWLTYWCCLWLWGVSGGLEPPRAATAQLTIYRQKEFGGHSYTIHVNGRKAGWLPPNHYLSLLLPPGRTKIESGKEYYTDPQVIFLTLQAGGVYYLKAVEEMDFMSQTLLVAPVPEALARQQLTGLKPVKSIRSLFAD